jgi:DNA-binding ferritin-like protein
MSPCENHENIILKIEKLQNKTDEQQERIMTNTKCIEEVKESVNNARYDRIEDRTNQKNILRSINGISEKLDVFIKEIREELKMTNKRVSQLETNLAVNDTKTAFNMELNWKTIAALGGVTALIIQIVAGG